MYVNEPLDSTTATTKVGEENVVDGPDEGRDKLQHQGTSEDTTPSTKGHPTNSANQVCSAHAALEWMVRRKQAEENARQ